MLAHSQDEKEEEDEEGGGEVTAGKPNEALASAAAAAGPPPPLLPDQDQHLCTTMSTAATTTIHRKSSTFRRGTPAVKKSASSAVNGTSTKPSSPNHPLSNGGERTVKKLRLSKALTIPEGTMLSEACRRMAHRRMDAVLLTDSNGLLSGIVTDKDIAVRVVAEGLRPDQTLTSKIMTRNPIFVSSDSLAIDALQTMVQGKFRHLPVVENGEVTALLDITKCLYDAISRMEKAAEQGSAIAAVVEGVERQLGGDFSAHYNIIETLRERMFKPSLSTIITENTKVAVVSPTDTVYLAMRKMREHRLNSVVIVTGGKPQGILTSKDVLMRVVAQNLSPELTFVEKVMTPNPERATLDTTILDALHIMHDGKFLHLPVVDQDGCIATCVDVLQIAHATISMARGPGTANDTTSTMMQKFWDSTLALEPPDDECETQSELSALMTSDGAETSKSLHPSLGLGQFSFKFEDQKGQKHRLNCGSESLNELLTSVMERIGSAYNRDDVRLLYEDDEGDKVVLVSDSDLVGAVNDARSAGLKVLKLHIDGLDVKKVNSELSSSGTVGGWTNIHTAVISGAIVLAGVGIMAYSKRSSFRFLW